MLIKTLPSLRFRRLEAHGQHTRNFRSHESASERLLMGQTKLETAERLERAITVVAEPRGSDVFALSVAVND